MILTGSDLTVVIGYTRKDHQKLTENGYELQVDQINNRKNWKMYHYDIWIWFADDHWCIGEGKDKGTETCIFKAPSSNGQWPTDLLGQWMFLDSDYQEWIKAGNDINVLFSYDLPYNRDNI